MDFKNPASLRLCLIMTVSLVINVICNLFSLIQAQNNKIAVFTLLVFAYEHFVFVLGSEDGTMVYSVEQDTFIVMSYYRNGTFVNAEWGYPVNACK